VVGLAKQEREGPVELLDQHQARQPVGERHPGERHHLPGPLTDRWIEPFVAANAKDQLPAGIPCGRNEPGQLDRVEERPPLVQRDQPALVPDLGQQRLGLTAAGVGRREGALCRRKLEQLDVRVPPESLRVALDPGLEPPGPIASQGEDADLQATFSLGASAQSPSRS
jgi:hypothetical protein